MQASVVWSKGMSFTGTADSGHTVAIGTGWMGDGDAHQTDERLAIKSLYKMARIYAHLFYRLVTAPTP